MYPVSLDYQEKIKSDDRLFECKIQVEHSQGTLYLTDKDLVLDSLIFTEATQPGEEFTIGGTVASDISFTILNKPEYENIKFIGATVFVNIGLQIQEGVDAHFLQPSQPSKMKGFDEKWEYVPLGRFNIDVADRQKNTIQIKAIDNMINLDKPYSLSKLSYPATLYQIYTNICNIADVPVGTTNFPNKDYVVNIRPDSDLTLRDVLGYVAELAGCFAKCNRHGAVELRWYEETDLIIKPNNRSNFKHTDDLVQIKGVMATVDGTTYLTGSEDYAIDLTENPLLQGDYETVLPVIYNNVKDTVFTPYTSDWQGNPAIQAGDKIVQIDRDGKEYNTLVTKSVYKYRGKSILEAKGLPEISRGYKGSTNRKLAEIRRKIDVEVGDKLTTLEEQQLQATELIANMLGGYAIKTEEAFYIADNEDLNLAQKVWKWGIGGFGYSEDGGETYTTGITADGSIVAMLVAANIITADMVQTGILQSEDGSTWINLDNGEFNFKDQMKWIDGKLKMGDKTEISWGSVEDKPWIPQNAADIGARPDNWTPTWAEIQSKPTILSADDIRTTVITKDWIGTLGLLVGSEIQMGSNAKISWGNVTGKPTIPTQYTDAQAVQAWKNSGYATNITSTGLYTGTITANKVVSGLLQSTDNSTWINLNDGSFNFKNALVWSSNKMQVIGDFITYSGGRKAVEISNKSLYFYDWEGIRTTPIGELLSAREIANNAPSLTLSNHANSILNLSYLSGSTYYPYISLDYYSVKSDTIWGIPITLWEDMNLAGIVYLGNSAEARIYVVSRELVIDGARDGWSLNQGGYRNILYDIDYDEITFYNGSYFRSYVDIRDDLYVQGSKDGLQTTENYGERLISAYETAEYYYGDIGSGIINENGECLIHIDEIFQECVNTNINYHIFTQKYNGSIDNIRKEKSYFVVYGEPNTEFSWELKAKRIGYENQRLEVPNREKGCVPSTLGGNTTEIDMDNNKDVKRILEGELEFDLSNILLTDK